MEPKRFNLHGQILNVSVNHILPFCDLTRNTQNELELSIDLELLKTAEKYFNFTANLINQKQDWGLIDSKGLWTGSTGSVVNRVSCSFCVFISNYAYNRMFFQTSQLAICSMDISYERSEVVDFSHFILENEIIFASQTPGISSTHQWLLGAAFQFPLWLLILFTFCLLCICLRLTHFPVSSIAPTLIALFFRQACMRIVRKLCSCKLKSVFLNI